jgi:hypothetical protein
MLGLPVMSSNIDKRDAHTLQNSRSPIMSASDAEMRVVDNAVARSVSAAYRLSSDTPCSFATVHTGAKLGGR